MPAYAVARATSNSATSAFIALRPDSIIAVATILIRSAPIAPNEINPTSTVVLVARAVRIEAVVRGVTTAIMVVTIVVAP